MNIGLNDFADIVPALDAWTLEWGTSSPPPEWNFDRIPTVTSARPLWDRKNPEDADAHYG